MISFTLLTFSTIIFLCFEMARGTIGLAKQNVISIYRLCFFVCLFFNLNPKYKP